MEAATIAKGAGAVISYDPNYRASLWKDEKTAVEGMKSAIPLADVMKVSDEECLLLTGAATYEEAADQLLAMGPKLVTVCWWQQKKENREYRDLKFRLWIRQVQAIPSGADS